MIVQCPSCRFERNVPDSSLRPGKTYKVTCPRCSSVFQFSMPEREEFLFTPEESADIRQESAVEAPAVHAGQQASAGESVERNSERAGADAQPAKDEEAPSSSLSAVQEGDGPLSSDASRLSPEKEEPRSGEEQPQEPVSQDDADNDEKDLEEPQAEREDDVQHRNDGRPDGAPWESPEYYGFFGSFSRTLLGVLFHAPDFFRHVKCQFSVIRPILFYVLMSLFQVLCARLWSIKALRELSATASDPQTLAMAEQLMQSMNMPLMLLITPFFSIFQAVILAGIYHLMIRMVQPDRADFATTLRVVCYSAAPLVLCLVPMFGSVIATVWSVLTVFVGCRFALRLSWMRTVLALLPLYILELAFISQIPALMAV